MRSPYLPAFLGALSAVIACGAGSSDVADRSPMEAATDKDASTTTPPPAPATPVDAGTNAPEAATPKELPDPVVFVHGINGDSAQFKVMLDRFALDGWPSDRLSAIDYPDPAWGCNVDNAEFLRQHVMKVLADTGAKKIDLVAHSMGSLSSRKFMKDLDGAAVVSTYVTLGGPHHGVPMACLNPLDVCVWNELCGSKPFLTALNTDPVIVGPAIWVSIFSHDDKTVPSGSSPLPPPCEDIAFNGIDHDGPDGLLERPEVYAEVKRVLLYPNP
jgi:triacylglycerol lipase